MRNILRKEVRLGTLTIVYFFVLFGLMFLLPGYPVLCGAFFLTLGLYQNFRYARECNDLVFSALLPIAKQDVVKGKFAFSCIIEMCCFALMLVSALVRIQGKCSYECKFVCTWNGSCSVWCFQSCIHWQFF